jgi:hypothetical protein
LLNVPERVNDTVTPVVYQSVLHDPVPALVVQVAVIVTGSARAADAGSRAAARSAITAAT